MKFITYCNIYIYTKMPKKLHIGYTRLSNKNIDNYLKGKSFTVKPSDHEDETNQVVKLHYKAKKNL